MTQSAATAKVGAVGTLAVGAMTAGRMRAWRVHAYGAAPQWECGVRRPALRAPDHVLVRVHTASINPIDIAMIGGYGRRVLNALRALDPPAGADDHLELPLVVGRDFLGEVVCAGADCRLRRGAIVWGAVPPHWPGSLADYVVVRDRWAGPAPLTLGGAAGGTLYAALSATSALRAAGLPAGTGSARGARVLVLGVGAVGHVAVQLLAADGARVTVGCASDQHERAAAAGAMQQLDRHAPDYYDRLVTCGPYDAIIDCAGLGGDEAGARGWQYGRYVTLSSPLLHLTDGRGVALGAVSAAFVLGRQCTRAGGAVGSVRWAYFTPCAADIELLRRRAEDGKLSVCIEREYAAEDAGAALSAAEGAARARGKVLLRFAPSSSSS